VNAIKLLVLIECLLPISKAQFIQQGSKLAGPFQVAGQGASVALSADGNTAILGVPGVGATGAAQVYTRSGGVWGPQGSSLIGTGAVGLGATQGDSVALSADGNTAIVGGPNDNNNAGAAWVFTRTSGVWSQQGSKLVGTGGNRVSGQGLSVALSADGNTAMVGGPGAADASDVGAVWVYTRSGGVWSQQGNKLIGTGVNGCCAQQGVAAALSADGNTALVGGQNDSNGGSAWVFTRSGAVWNQQGNKLAGTGAIGSATQGTSVALSGDGNTAMVGGPYDNGSAGATWVYKRSGGVWTQQGGKLVGTGAVGVAFQGRSVALSADGTTALVGGPFDHDNAGAGWVFVNPAIVPAAPSILSDGTGIINGGSYLPGNVVSGSWVAIKGAGFTDQTTDWSSFDFSKGLLPVALNGVQVFFNGQPGAVWYLIAGTPQQINVQAPANLSGSVSVQVIRNGVLSNTVTTTAVQVAPAIFAFTLDSGRTFVPSAVFLDGSRLGDPATFPGAHKAKAGDKVSLYANSLAPSPAGVVPVSGSTHPVMVTIGPATFAADFSGLVAPGEFLINITVPRLPDSVDYPIALQIDGQSSQGAVFFPYTNN